MPASPRSDVYDLVEPASPTKVSVNSSGFQGNDDSGSAGVHAGQRQRLQRQRLADGDELQRPLHRVPEQRA